MDLAHVDNLERIAAEYAAAPVFEAEHVAAWRELAADSVAQAARLRTRFRITDTDDPEPYPDAPAMFRDLSRGRFTVSRANSEHPLWTPTENVAFRIVHDIAGHFSTGGHFDWRGENMACSAHERMLAPAARVALFTECIAQTAFCNVFGYFGAQKVAALESAW